MSEPLQYFLAEGKRHSVERLRHKDDSTKHAILFKVDDPMTQHAESLYISPQTWVMYAHDPALLSSLWKILRGVVEDRNSICHGEPHRCAELRDDSIKLDPMDVQILNFVAEGLPYAEIAKRMFVSERTVKYRMHDLFTKRGLVDIAAATAWAARHGII
jgi:DNA-binding CsgD family transcriptional regulator